ncbi:hypothetical protein ACFPOH_11545, partial [Ureibacillus suwonensis]
MSLMGMNFSENYKKRLGQKIKKGLSKKSIKTERMEKTMSFSIRSVSLFLKLVWEFAALFSM